MKIDLKPFQLTAARQLLDELFSARAEVERRLKPQALALSSPTGSGKTVTITALMEWIYTGYESFPADPEAVFLWLSDSPELNTQSRDKILRQSSVFAEPDLIIVDSTFEAKVFEPGRVYFLNTQKLSRDSLLTRKGDLRTYSIWDTIQNTSSACPAHFYVIIDEAHRGMNETKRDREQATTIVQRFIKGWANNGVILEPIKLIVGMSATPERFLTLISGDGGGRTRILRPVEINPEDVKASGLLKERIILYHPARKQPSDWTLLEAAVHRWQDYGRAWSTYCQSQGMDRVVEPVLVIQVEDGKDKQITRTDLDQLVRVVERVTGTLPDTAWAHAFQEDRTIEASGHRISKIQASKVETETDVRIVLFKMSLSTGWDCPRAETMMSFRRARDYTLIAQLVGRMVRTPLARSIENDQFLNSVALYLPYYDAGGLQTILSRLNAPDPETGLAVTAEDGATLVTYPRTVGKEGLFEILESLPTYRIEHVEKISNVRRVVKLGRQLTNDEIDPNAWGDSKRLVVRTLERELERLGRKRDFIGNIADNQEIELREVWVEYGEWRDLGTANTVRIRVTPENLDSLFGKCKSMLGEGLHMEFWKARREACRDNADRAKLELYVLLQEQSVWTMLEQVCGAKIDEWFGAYSAAIRGLPSSRQEVYNRIRRLAKQPEPETLFLPSVLELRQETPEWDRHLYADANGQFGVAFNTWESDVMQVELRKREVIGWLRNIPRQKWALCIPYQKGTEFLGMYPDLLVFRKDGERILVDLLDPHNPELEDAPHKAVGLAKYAHLHGDRFGRIELIMVEEQRKRKRIRRLNLNDSLIREKVAGIVTREELTQLFRYYGVD